MFYAVHYDNGVLFRTKPAKFLISGRTQQQPSQQQAAACCGSAQRLTMESSGGVSLPQLPGSLERISSYAESDSAFSNATEAESEVTEGGGEEGFITPRQTYFMCYATDLLSAYEQIKKRSQSGVRAIDDVSVWC